MIPLQTFNQKFKTQKTQKYYFIFYSHNILHKSAIYFLKEKQKNRKENQYAVKDLKNYRNVIVSLKIT